MVVTFVVGDLLTGGQLQTLNPISGDWSEALNDAGDVSCVVSLNDPINRRLDLFSKAAVGKAFLAAIDGDTVLQAGPIWLHRFDGVAEKLTLTAKGMWSYFDHRMVLPVLAGRNPTDTTTDTRFSNVVSDPDEPGYPWVSDTRQSLQTIAKRLVEQAQTWTGGNVPVVLPSEIAGTNERWYKGSALGNVGQRLKEIAASGPDIMFTPRLKTDRMFIEWVMRIGTPTEPLLYSPQRQIFQLGLAEPSLSNLVVTVDGARMASQAFAVGGRTDGQGIITVSNNSTLPTAGYPLLEIVDSTHSTVSEESTLQQYSDAAVTAGQLPLTTWSFDHQLSRRPFLESFNAGDFATVSVRNNAYIRDGRYNMRILTRSGDITGRKVRLTFSPEITSG